MPNQAPPLYALRLVAPGHFTLAKFTMPDFNVEATYNLIAKGTGYACDCPASARVVKYKPCKHQRMLPFMLGAVNTDRFYEPESRSWCQPLAPDLVGEAAQQSGAPIEAEPREVSGKINLPEPTQDQREYLDKIAEATGKYDPNVVVGGPAPKLRRRV